MQHFQRAPCWFQQSLQHVARTFATSKVRAYMHIVVCRRCHFRRRHPHYHRWHCRPRHHHHRRDYVTVLDKKCIVCQIIFHRVSHKNNVMTHFVKILPMRLKTIFVLIQVSLIEWSQSTVKPPHERPPLIKDSFQASNNYAICCMHVYYNLYSLWETTLKTTFQLILWWSLVRGFTVFQHMCVFPVCAAVWSMYWCGWGASEREDGITTCSRGTTEAAGQ